MIELRGVHTPPDADASQLLRAAAKRLRIPETSISDIKILKRAVDARKKPDVRFVYTLTLHYSGSEAALVKKCKSPDVRIYEAPTPFALPHLRKTPVHRPIVCGAGPAGLFAAPSAMMLSNGITLE